MRRNLCAFRWPRATASLLSITAALALHGCSKPGAMSRLPDLSGKAAADADDRGEVRKREEALAGTRPGPKVGTSGKASLNAEPKEPARSAGPVTVDRSGLAAAPPKSSSTSLESTARNAHEARGRAALEAPEIPASASKPGTTGSVAQRSGDRDGGAGPSQISGASWSGSATGQKVSPASREQPARNVATTGTAGSTPLDGGKTASRRSTPVAASPETGDAGGKRSTAVDWNTRVAAAPVAVAAVRTTEKNRDDHPSSSESQSRFQVERLMEAARTHVTRGELFSAQRTALLAERMASRENVSFGADEEHPADLVRLIDREIDLSGGRAVASEAGFPESRGDVPPAFEEAAGQFASWRPAEESARPRLQVQTVSGSSEVDPVAAMDRKPFAPKGPEIVPARGESVTSVSPGLGDWNHVNGAGRRASEPSWKTDRSPVALSSAISGVDDSLPESGERESRIVPAVSEGGGRPFGSPGSLTVPAGNSTFDAPPLFMPSVNLPGQDSSPAAAEVGGDSLAVANGPLLPATSATQALDNVWEEELVPAAGESSEGFGKGFWALTSGILAAGAILFGVARRVRSAERGV